VSVASISAAASAATPPVATTRTADGDYKAANVRSAQTRDSDGDFKSAAAQSSAGLQASLTSLKIGG